MIHFNSTKEGLQIMGMNFIFMAMMFSPLLLAAFWGGFLAFVISGLWAITFFVLMSDAAKVNRRFYNNKKTGE